MELILTDEEFHDLLFVALGFALEQLPDQLAHLKDLEARMMMFYKMSPEDYCSFVIIPRSKEIRE